MNQLNTSERAKIISCLVEGCSIRSTVRLTGAAKKTVQRLSLEFGIACREWHNKTVRNLKCQRIQCDEVWSFVGCKQKNVPKPLHGQFGIGDVWTWVAFDADTKLIVSWLIGQRTVEWACEFMQDVRDRLSNRVQLTTDGHRPYLQATEKAFNWDVDYSMLEKHYGMDQNKGQCRYSPAKLQSIKVRHICGNADSKHISTSFVERQNLTMRMAIRRFTRLTNAFSKRIDNHQAAIAIHFCWYNFVRVHQTLRVTPAMEAGLTDHVWTMEELIETVLKSK